MFWWGKRRCSLTSAAPFQHVKPHSARRFCWPRVVFRCFLCWLKFLRPQTNASSILTSRKEKKFYQFALHAICKCDLKAAVISVGIFVGGGLVKKMLFFSRKFKTAVSRLATSGRQTTRLVENERASVEKESEPVKSSAWVSKGQNQTSVSVFTLLRLKTKFLSGEAKALKW